MNSSPVGAEGNQRTDAPLRCNLNHDGLRPRVSRTRAVQIARPVLPFVLFATILAPGACARPRTETGFVQRNLSPISEQHIEDPSGKAMLGFYSAMTRTLSRCDEPACQNVTRILHYGDSHVASGLLTGPLRASFQRDLGDAGPGFIFGGRPWSWYKPYAASITASSGWHTGGLG